MQIVINIGLDSAVKQAKPAKQAGIASVIKQEDFDQEAAELDVQLMMRHSMDDEAKMKTELKVLDWVKKNIKDSKKIQKFMDKAKDHIDSELRASIYELLKK